MNQEAYNLQGDLYTTSLHYSYCKKADSPTIIQNNNVKETKILLIKDSFSMVVAPFLTLSTNEVVMWDVRANNEGLFDYKGNNDFDVVLVVYTDFWQDNMYEFN